MDISVASPYQALIGTTLAGRYKVLQLIGTGGMSVVFKAHNTQMDNIVCIKILRNELLGADQTGFRRLHTEAKALACLDHSNILRIIAMESDGDRIFLVTEFVDGVSLDQTLKQGPLSPERAKRIFLQISEGLEYAHSKGVVHRDLKPSNIILSNSDGIERAKILDFGIAKLLDADTFQRLTRSGMLLGTPHYMAPEQCEGGRIDPRADIYSLGCMLAECLNGKTPFAGESAVEIMMKHINEAPPVVPGPLGPIAMRAMEKNVDQRFQSADDVVAALNTGSLPPPRAIPREGARTKIPVTQLTATMAAFACAFTIALCIDHFGSKPIGLPAHPENVSDPRISTILLRAVLDHRNGDQVRLDEAFRRQVDALLCRKDLDAYDQSDVCSIKGRVVEVFGEDRRTAEEWQSTAVQLANSVGRVNPWAVTELAHLMEVRSADDEAEKLVRDQLARAEKRNMSNEDRILLNNALVETRTHKKQDWFGADPIYAALVDLQKPGSYEQAIAFHRRITNLMVEHDHPGSQPLAKKLLADYLAKYFDGADEMMRDELALAKLSVDDPGRINTPAIKAVADRIQVQARDRGSAQWLQRVVQLGRAKCQLGEAYCNVKQWQLAEQEAAPAWQLAVNHNDKYDIDHAEAVLSLSRRAQGNNGKIRI
jgi:hypothetical protein